MRYIIILMCITIWIMLHGRSIHRPHPACSPYINAYWSNDPSSQYALHHKTLQYWPFFTRFDYRHVVDNSLPLDYITYRHDPTKSLQTSQLKAELNHCIQHIVRGNNKTSEYGNFTIIKDRDFNYRYNAGVIILKHKQHPFIVKLFMETPYTLTKPYSKGIEPCFFFSMTGGSSRFFAGFTRIKNKMRISEKVEQSDTWRDMVTVPRKWFWVPDDTPWITIEGHHISGDNHHDTIEVPSTYAIISDIIHTKSPHAMFKRAHRKRALQLTHYIGEERLDPHIDNFVIEQETNQIALIDTEHFASMTGLEERMEFSNYCSWYLQLARKCVKDIFLRSKRERNRLHTRDIPDPLQV